MIARTNFRETFEVRDDARVMQATSITFEVRDDAEAGLPAYAVQHGMVQTIACRKGLNQILQESSSLSVLMEAEVPRMENATLENGAPEAVNTQLSW